MRFQVQLAKAASTPSPHLEHDKAAKSAPMLEGGAYPTWPQRSAYLCSRSFDYTQTPAHGAHRPKPHRCDVHIQITCRTSIPSSLTDIRTSSGSHLGEVSVANLPIRAATAASPHSMAHAEPAIKPKICSKARCSAVGNHPRLCQLLLHKAMTLPSSSHRIASHRIVSYRVAHRPCPALACKLHAGRARSRPLPHQTEQPAIWPGLQPRQYALPSPLTSCSPPHVTYPSLLLPTCFHACFHPACHRTYPTLLLPGKSQKLSGERVFRIPNLSRLWKHAWKTVPALQEPMASGVRVEIYCGHSGHVEGGRRSVGHAKRSGVEEVWKGRGGSQRDSERCVAMRWNDRRHVCEGLRAVCLPVLATGEWRLKGDEGVKGRGQIVLAVPTYVPPTQFLPFAPSPPAQPPFPLFNRPPPAPLPPTLTSPLPSPRIAISTNATNAPSHAHHLLCPIAWIYRLHPSPARAPTPHAAGTHAARDFLSSFPLPVPSVLPLARSRSPSATYLRAHAGRWVVRRWSDDERGKGALLPGGEGDERDGQGQE
ncbi:hypothetical protein PMIN01_02817 [Paraphaeosphaeria minitans]|uniref:Uncharacterized protein n=1 Tax=Paraphaeosphaeria minitans TaxID=565426 RepID=A0A9P6KV95_9PLEO|nr:hypothetical protein PMIN01_02817 [Paraphaeosphaeria minitans]